MSQDLLLHSDKTSCQHSIISQYVCWADSLKTDCWRHMMYASGLCGVCGMTYCGSLDYHLNLNLHTTNQQYVLLEHMFYSILWPFMWYIGMCSANRDQAGQRRSITMTSQWPLIITPQRVLKFLEIHIVKS